MEETVTSTREPGWEKGGRVAEIITEAVFFTVRVVGVTVTPMRCSRLARLWAENMVCRRSPVPASPTTSP